MNEKNYDIKELMSLQRDFFNSQATKNVHFRIKQLKKLRSAIRTYRQDIIDAIYKDFKKSEFEVLSSEIGIVMDELDIHIRKLRSWTRPKKIFPHLANFISFDKIYHDPFGQVLIISPWNYPFNLAITPLIGAISGGNTVVLKPSEFSPNTSAVVKEIIQSIFEPKYVAVVEGDVKTARALLDEKWNFIFFTGSPSIGKYVYQAAAKNLTPVVLELGGKSPVVIDKTADISVATRRIVWGKFLNNGQTCIAPDYVLIAKDILNDFIGKLKKEIEIFYGKNPQKSNDYARIINLKNFKRLQRTLENQDIIIGGETNEADLYISPTVVLNPDMDSELMQYEIFGPILPVITYENKNEVEKIVGLYPNPLAFYIFSKDKKYQKYLIDKFAFGGGVINDVLVHFINPRLPFGGVGNSGIGKYHGKYSFEAFTREKPVIRRKIFPDLPVRYLPVSEFKKKIIRWIFKI